MRKTRTALIIAIAIGLLAGSAIAVAAQTEEASGEATPFEGAMPFSGGSSAVSGVAETQAWRECMGVEPTVPYRVRHHWF